MPEVTIDVSHSGGSVVAILAKDFDIPLDYAFHPQIISILASELEHDSRQISDKIPSTTRIVVIGGEIPRDIFGALRTALSRRKLTFVQRKNPAAMQSMLEQVLPSKKAHAGGNGIVHVHGQQIDTPLTPETEAALGVAMRHAKRDDATQGDHPRKRGEVTEFVKENADLNKGSAEEGRRLFKIAQARGLQTTVSSLEQAIAVLKRKGGRTETPKSIMTAQQKALKTLDDAIAGLQLIREYVSETEALNADLTTKLNKFRALLKED